jgi:TGS domain
MRALCYIAFVISHMCVAIIGDILFVSAVILSDIRKGTTVRSLCANISTQLLRDLNYALVWGTSAKHSPQRCGLSHKLEDEDVVQIVAKTIKQQQQDKSYGVLAQQFQDKHAKKRQEAKKQKQKKLRG